MRKRETLAAMLAVLLSAGVTLAQDAYRLTPGGDAIVIDRDSHWRNWNLQNNLVSDLFVRADSTSIFTIEDGVSPRFMRRRINAALNIQDFFYIDAVRTGALTQGGVVAKSNQPLAADVADGDMETYWEPAVEDFDNDGLRDWEVELDLGRMVHVDSVTLVFPSGEIGLDGEEDLGDPFKAFALFGSTGERSGERQGQTDSKNLRFDFIARATDADLIPGANGQLLSLTVPVEPLDDADFDQDGAPEMTGSMLQYLRVKVTGSSLGRKTFLGDGEEARVEYESLAPARQGDRVYQRVTAGGFLSPVSQGVYDTLLAVDQRGPIRYFIKEVPRLLEIQVWGKGDNIAYAPETRAGASFEQGGWCGSGGSSCNATDGLLQTWWTANVWSRFVNRGTLWIDLGATFWVDRASMVLKWTSGRTKGSFMGNGFWLSDGTLLNPVNLQSVADFGQLETGLQWDNIIPKLKFDNLDAKVRMFEESFPLRKVRYIMARNVDPTGGEWEGAYVDPGNLSELALYGEGYPVSVFLNSPPILLNDTEDIGSVQQTTLSKISWFGEAVVQRPDPETGALVEVVEPLSAHPEVSLSIQTRTSERTDTTFAYFASTDVSTKEITQQDYEDLQLQWAIYNYVVENNIDTRSHRRSKDEDGDGQKSEDWFDGIDNDGDGLIDEDWTRVRPGRDIPKQTPLRTAKLEFTGWSTWSAQYRPTGGLNEAIITSPSPRKFLQIRVNLQSQDPLKAAKITGLRVDLVRPLSLSMAGELALLTPVGSGRDLGEVPIPDDYLPPVDVNPLVPHDFSYFIRAAGPDPQQRQVRNGFNEILIRTREPSQFLGLRTGTVRMDGEQARTTTFTESFVAGADGVFRGVVSGDSLAIVPTGPDSLLVVLPASLNRGLRGSTHGIVEVRFRTTSVREGTEFESFVRNSGDEFFQRVDVANRDATELVVSNTVQVRLDNSFRGLVHNVTMLPYVTPNGDLVNDELQVSFTLLRVLEAVPMEVSFYDLGGNLVRRIESEQDFVPLSAAADEAGGGENEEEAVVTPFTGDAGQIEFTWDARDEDGRLVPPGIYVMRIRIVADRGDNDVVRSISVVY